MLTDREFSELTYMLMTGQGLNPGAAAHAQTLVAAFERENPKMSRFLRDRITRNGLDPSDAGTQLAHSLNRGRRPPASDLAAQQPARPLPATQRGKLSPPDASSAFPTLSPFGSLRPPFATPSPSRGPINSQDLILQQQPLHPIQINPRGRRER